MDLKIMLTILFGVVVLVYVVVSLILGHKINLKEIVNIKEYILSILPSVINACEGLEGSDTKKEVAITTTMSYVQDKFGTLEGKDLNMLVNYTSKRIEEILSTPTKKTVKED